MKKFALIIISALLIFGCQKNSGSESAGDRLKIVVTGFPLYDFARAVSKDRADITMLIKPGSDAHSYDPSPMDIMKIEQSNIFIYMGGEGDSWVKNVLSSISNDKLKVIRIFDFIPPYIGEQDDNMSSHNHHMDEHIWTSPIIAQQIVDVISREIADADAVNKDFYLANAYEYREKISSLDMEFRTLIDGSDRRAIIVADRFPFMYFAEEYSLDHVSAFPGCDVETDISVSVMADLINAIKDGGYKYIYYVELSNQKIADAVSGHTGAEKLLLHSIQNVTADEFSSGETYVSLMRKNLENLRRGLE